MAIKGVKEVATKRTFRTLRGVRTIETRGSPPRSSLAERMKNILSSNKPLSGEERFILEYARLVAEFRLIHLQKRGKENGSPARKVLELKEKAGKRIGFSDDQLIELNVFFREVYREEGGLNELVGRISKRISERPSNKASRISRGVSLE